MSSFRDADLFRAATAAAPVEQCEAGGEREGQLAMSLKYNIKNFHQCDTFTATTPSCSNTVYICIRKIAVLWSFIHFIVCQRKKINSLNIKKVTSN